MPKSSANIISDALDLLGRGPGVGQSVPPEDYATVNAFITPLYKQLSADQIVTIGDPENLPDEIYIPLTWLLANAAAPKFDVPQSDDGRKTNEQTIRRLVAARPTYETLRTEYF